MSDGLWDSNQKWLQFTNTSSAWEGQHNRISCWPNATYFVLLKGSREKWRTGLMSAEWINWRKPILTVLTAANNFSSSKHK